MKQLDATTLQTVKDKIIAHGTARAKNMGTDFNEADFIAGAGAVMDALGMWNQFPRIFMLIPKLH